MRCNEPVRQMTWYQITRSAKDHRWLFAVVLDDSVDPPVFTIVGDGGLAEAFRDRKPAKHYGYRPQLTPAANLSYYIGQPNPYRWVVGPAVQDDRPAADVIVDLTAQSQVPPPKPRMLALSKPPKPITQMTDEERHGYAQQVFDAFRAPARPGPESPDPD